MIFRKKRANVHEALHKLAKLPPQALIRNIIYDSMCKDPEGVAFVLGLSPVSDEVSEMEDKASDGRLTKFASLIPLIEQHSEIAGKISAANYAINQEPDDEVMPEEIALALSIMFKLVAFSSAVSCISQLVDLGLLEVTYGKR